MTIEKLTPLVISSQALPGGPPGVPGPAGSSAAYVVNGQSGTTAYTAKGSDGGSLIIFSGTVSGVSFMLDATALTAGWWVTIKNNNTAGAVTLSVLGGFLLDGATTGAIDPNGVQTIVFAGQGFETLEASGGGTF